jgi:AmmeMemoRadiSam system radical SAM enzyme/AmmeMemoRadiSam system protein B/uncharacterized protein (TIGR00296 family)
MKEGDRGFCFVRRIQDGAMVLDTYGRSTGFCIDPIEKKPLNHFYPGTSVLSFGTAGCNLGCQFCQNWDISKSREVARLSDEASPASIARAASELGCASVAFTYNDPVVWAEYAIDTAKECRQAGIHTVAVTAGYMMPEARREFYPWIDAANVDLKAFSEEFYRKITYSHLEPVLDTLRFLKHETDVWFELTNLVIPGENDSADELRRMCDWITAELGADVPIHFSAFHPDFRMRDKPNTPHEKLLEAYAIARAAGLRYVYLGNVHDSEHDSTMCWKCGTRLIERDWYEIRDYSLQKNRCGTCGAEQAGRFGNAPGHWGRKRQPVDMRRFQSPSSPQSAFPEPNLVRLESVRTPRPRDGVSLTVSPDRSPTEPKSPTRPSMSQSSLSMPTKLDVLKLATLTEDQRRVIQRAAQHAVACSVLRKPVPADAFESLGELADAHVYGVFTTLKRGEQLRGCCGFLGRPTPLRDGLLESAQRTAREDHRMPAISSIELPYLSCHVNLLGAPLPVDGPPEERVQAIEIGRHGVRISSKASSPYGERAGLFLPSVPVEQGWDVQEYLESLCRKAGLPDDAWSTSDTRLEFFEGLEIDGGFDSELLPDPIPITHAPGDFESLFRLKQAAMQNLIALSHGGTPNYYVLDAMDGTVHALVLSAINTDTQRPMGHWIQTSLRPGLPLQTTLFELCKLVEQTLRRTRFDKSVDIDMALTVLHDPAHHGSLHAEDWEGATLRDTLGHCDLRGVDPSKRGILAMCGERVAVAIDPNKSPHELVSEAAAMVRVRHQPIAIVSLGCVSTVSSLLASNQVGVDSRPINRKAALADAFYPSDANARHDLMDSLASASSDITPEPALAIMTPHAGLRYSGAIAIDAWKSATLPPTVVILGPKHTNLGAPWAVSPSPAWELPGGPVFDCDVELAQRIVKTVEGMEFDAAAHAREHGAEVQLPVLEFLARIGSPPPKLVCIAMAQATWPELQLAAKQLANVLREMEPRPLLVISSDMNHFADENENRRKDSLALEAMQSGDPKLLLETCHKQAISMCGVLPAALVLQTLHEAVALARGSREPGQDLIVAAISGVLLCEGLWRAVG